MGAALNVVYNFVIKNLAKVSKFFFAQKFSREIHKFFLNFMNFFWFWFDFVIKRQQ